MLLVTRDPHNTPRLKRHKSILRPTSGATLGTETNITDVTGAQLHLAFRDLMDIYIEAPTTVQLEESLYARLAS